MSRITRQGGFSGCVGLVSLLVAAILPGQEGGDVAPARRPLWGAVKAVRQRLDAGELEAAREASSAAWRAYEEYGTNEDPEVVSALQELAVLAERLAQSRIVHAVRSRVLVLLRSGGRPGTDRGVLRARVDLGNSHRAIGDLQTSIRSLREACADAMSVLAEDDPLVQHARLSLAASFWAAGDVEASLLLEQQVVEVLERTRPADDLDLQIARGNLALSLKAIGKIAAARDIEEEVLRVREAVLPAEDPAVLAAYGNLADTMFAFGQLERVEALLGHVIEVQERTLPDEHPDLQNTRTSLAATLATRGDLQAAATLFERVWSARRAALPEGHPAIQAARQNLAVVRRELGDHTGALALLEKAHEELVDVFPADHPDLIVIRGNLAVLRRMNGDLGGALELENAIVEVLETRLEPTHPELCESRLNLATTLASLGELERAKALLEVVVEARSDFLAPSHPDLLIARANLASTLRLAGEHEQALQILGELADIVRRAFPVGHPLRQLVLRGLAWTSLDAGDRAGAVDALLEATGGSIARISTLVRAPRDVGRTAAAERATVLGLAAVARECSDDARREQSIHLVLRALACMRGAETRAHFVRRRARGIDPVLAAGLEQQIQDAVQRIAAAVDSASSVAEAEDRVRSAELEKDALEAELVALAATSGARGPSAPQVVELSEGLGADEALVVFFAHPALPVAPVECPDDRWMMSALLLLPGGGMHWCELSSLPEIERAIADYRTAARGRSRGERVEEEEQSSVSAAGSALRALVLDPISSVLHENTRRLLVSGDGPVELVPLDALAREGGGFVGDQYQIVRLGSPRDVLRASIGASSWRRFVGVGGLDYDAGADATTPASGSGPSAAAPEWFPPLPDSRDEVRALAAIHERAFADGGERIVLEGDQATVERVVAAAESADVLHLATHAYFGRGAEWIGQHDRGLREIGGLDYSIDDVVAGLSPLVLTGLALTGANRAPSAMGRRTGLLVAEDVAQLDLSGCSLVTLSACGTALGVDRDGQGHASLENAFAAAGVRYIVTTLWEVGDAEARRLMSDFYRRLWSGVAPQEALWLARMAARRQGSPYRDWAGFVLSGR
jgi:CHAT domain-containing protein/tetratricopeptide (TPR) repeat protein